MKLPLIRLTGVSVERQEQQILRRIDLTIAQGRHTAVLGPNGAGKTSLLRLLTRHYYPSVEASGEQGEVEILGRSDWQVAELRQRMGVVSASLDSSFSAGRTGRMRVEEAVASGFTATELAEFGVRLTCEVLEQVTVALQRVAAEHLRGRIVATLSTGERRRVMIARALVHRPEVLVLDEPTTGLDIAARHQVVGILRQVTKIAGLTLVLVTHHIEEVVPEIQDVLLLDQGQIIFAGPPGEAITGERLSTLFGLPLRIAITASGCFQVAVVEH